jgi:deoxyribonuclease V
MEDDQGIKREGEGSEETREKAAESGFRWPSGTLTPAEATALQKRLAKKVRIRPIEKNIRTIAGADVSLERFGTELFAGIVLFSYPDLTPICSAMAKMPMEFPYIPGLLSFREIPGLLECLKKLPGLPDLIMVDGQGIAHPRRLGIATHLSLATGIPTVGVAKSRLYGQFKEPKTVGAAEPITDPKTGEQLGWAFKSKERSKPLLVSPGHDISLEESLDIVKNCLRGYRLPEPTRKAHELVNKFRKGEVEGKNLFS